MMAFQVNRAREWYERALSQLPPVDRKSQRAGLVMAAIYRALLNEIERDGYRVLDRRIALTPLRKFGIAWTTAFRREHVGAHARSTPIAPRRRVGLGARRTARAVIGAGWAGCAAAVTLARLGHRVTVFETAARRRRTRAARRARGPCRSTTASTCCSVRTCRRAT